MKLPPVGLVAPTLCPRCDTPASGADGDRAVDQCPQCSLQLRWCGNCRGVAGPFDHYCGFCGFELLRGDKRSPLWRLSAAVALVPLLAGLGYGLWMARGPQAVAHLVSSTIRPSQSPVAVDTQYDSQVLGMRYAVPAEWTVVDYSNGPTRLPAVVVSRHPLDQTIATDAKGDLVQVDQANSTIVTFGRPQADVDPIADTRDPVATLASQVAPLAAAPPSGVRVEVDQPVRAVTVGGRPGAEVVLKLTRSGHVFYLRRVLVYAPWPNKPAMVRADALVPAGEWRDRGSVVASMVRSLNFA